MKDLSDEDAMTRRKQYLKATAAKLEAQELPKASEEEALSGGAEVAARALGPLQVLTHLGFGVPSGVLNQLHSSLLHHNPLELHQEIVLAR